MSSNTAAATAPTSVVIPAGESTAVFNVTAVDEVVIDDRATVTITASAAGHGSTAKSIEIINNDLFALPAGTVNDVVTLSPGPADQYFGTLGPKQPAFPGVTHLVPFAGESTFQTTGSVSVPGDRFIAVDRAKTYGLSGWAKSGDEFSQRYLAGNRQSFGFATYDADRLQILPEHVLKFATAVDTTLAAPLNPGDTKITLANAAGWSNSAGNDKATRGIAWYGYADSQGASPNIPILATSPSAVQVASGRRERSTATSLLCRRRGTDLPLPPARRSATPAAARRERSTHSTRNQSAAIGPGPNTWRPSAEPLRAARSSRERPTSSR